MTRATSAAIPALPPGVLESLVETTKPGITRLVTITSGVGFLMAWLSGLTTAPGLELFVAAAYALAGTALTAAGANAANQYLERRRDAAMRRTRGRPLPQARVAPAVVLTVATVLSLAGLALLLWVNGPIPASISLACIVSYTAVYTPLKPLTPLSTYVGTIPGALPPLIGWTAAAGPDAAWDALLGPSSWGGWSLVALMTIWQLPHFFALAWMYRDDYAAGGYRILSVLDETGARTSRATLVTAAILLPASLLPAVAMPQVVGWVYAPAAVILGVMFVRLSIRFAVERSRDAARRVFLWSIVYLPAVMTAMVGEAAVRRLIG